MSTPSFTPAFFQFFLRTWLPFVCASCERSSCDMQIFGSHANVFWRMAKKKERRGLRKPTYARDECVMTLFMTRSETIACGPDTAANVIFACRSHFPLAGPLAKVLTGHKYSQDSLRFNEFRSISREFSSF